jgi:broad specificity phosphatase PhoE
MKTTMYLIRHAAAEANAAGPERLQGARPNPPLGRLGVRQAELTRDFLAVRPLDACYCSHLLRAAETASIIAAPHGLCPRPLDGLADSERAAATLEELFARHAGHAFLVIAHHDVGSTYLAALLGLGPEQAGQVQLDNCGISVIVRDGQHTTVSTLNASFHLQGIAA